MIDNIRYRVTQTEGVREAMVTGWWYDAVDENGVLEIPETISVDGEVYTVVSLEGGALAEWKPREAYEEGYVELENPVYANRVEADYNGGEGDDWYLLGGTESEPELDYGYYFKYPTSIVLPDTIRFIGTEAFAGHGYWNETDGDYGLESVTIPADIMYIDHGAFWDSYQIREFIGLEDFYESTKPYRLFDGSIINCWGDEDILVAYPPQCEKTEYTVSGDIEVIGSNAFRWAEELTALTLEEGVRVLRNHAVIVTGLETLTLPNSLEELHGNALGYNGSMKTFAVNDDHPWLAVWDDGTLRADNGDTLIAYPIANIGEDRVLEIPDDITHIANVGMAGIDLHELIIPESVEHIDDWTFQNNDVLRTVTICGTIDTMNIDVFGDCDNLETINYYGDYINVYYYDGDEFMVAHDGEGTPEKFDFVMHNSDNISFFVAYDYDLDNRDYETFFPHDNPFFNLVIDSSDETLLGDIDGDGEVTPADRMTLARTVAGWDGYPLEALDMAAADIDRDGEITPNDRLILARHIAGWEGYESLESFGE